MSVRTSTKVGALIGSLLALYVVAFVAGFAFSQGALLAGLCK